jgi:NADPH:quinone reductase-like Zn-dependent oxidoreductase
MKMKAIICTRYGPPEVLQLKEVEKLVPEGTGVITKTRATAVRMAGIAQLKGVCKKDKKIFITTTTKR